MGETEEYFPRGGKKPIVSHFKQSSNFLGTAEKSDKKKRKPKKKAEGDDGYLSDEPVTEVDESYKNCAVGISYRTAKPGLLILGRIRQIHETKISLSLPCRMLGTVMACHVSEPYNKMLEAYVNDQADSVRDLNTMFRPGQYVAAKVLEANTEDSHTNLLMSMMPQHVNEGRTLADLHNGALLQAAVSSVEEHGYVMDIGVPNTTAFLPKKHANPELELDVGMLAWCSVKSCKTDSSLVTLTCELSSLQSATQRKSTRVLMPGTGVDFVVDKPLDNGIEGHVFKDTTCYVQRQHADAGTGKKPALGQKVRARVLYVMPTRNTPFLTLRDIFQTTFPDLEKEQKYKAGDIIEEAQVLKITGRCIHFRLRGGAGSMSLKWVAADDDLTDEEVLAKSYPPGSKHRVRIISYNMSDHSYSVSDQPSILSEKYFTLDQLTVGQLVTATVKAVDSHVLLSVGRMTGVVPASHLSDAGVYVDPKKATKSQLPKKKYKVGQEVTARVLSIDLNKQGLSLTLKPSLLSPDVEVLKSYQQAQVGKAYTGVIKYIKEEYLLVMFFSSVLGYVARAHAARGAALADLFHVGQIVNCTILKVDVEAKKMSGSLTVQPFTPGERPIKRKPKTDDDSDETPKKKQRGEEQTDKKRKKTTSVSEIEEPNKKNKDKKKRRTSESHDEGDQTEKSKKKKKTEEEVKSSEESDAIEVDLPDDVLTADDLQLIDLTDCVNAKKTKKRVLSLLKAIAARMKRVNKVEAKISSIEEKGLNTYNKKYHTAMQMEKSVVLERVKKLFEVLTIAQEKLKEFGDVEENLEYKKMKELRAQKQEAKKKEIEEKLKEKKKKKEEKKEQGEVGDKKRTSKKEKPIKEAVEQVTDVKEEKRKEKKKKKILDVPVIDSLEPAIEIPSAKEFWSTNAESLAKSVQEEESSSSEDEAKDQSKKKRKKLSAAEKVAKLREEEEKVREMERRALESESRPQSSEQFERALLANPDSSQLWIAYMAFHLQATEIDKARAIARKALSTINFREEQERLNVWLALLNCENRFGTKESLQKTLEEALQMNDTYAIHSNLLSIYQETSKHQELNSLVELMMRKYKRNPQCYTACGDACYKAGLLDKARQLMQKGMTVLEKKEHVSVLVHFALLERSHGARERSEALFEQLLAVYPQRVDVVSVYVDMLVKGGDVDHVRQVMERMTSQKLPARKMKILYKKWIEVEEKIGDEEHVEKIRLRAMEYIEKAKF